MYFWCYCLFQERCKMAKFIGDRLHHLENRLEDLWSSLTQQYSALRQHLLSSLHELDKSYNDTVHSWSVFSHVDYVIVATFVM